MNMVFQHKRYLRGEIVGLVDLARLFGPLDVPAEPASWFVLRVFPGREAKVMKTFAKRNVSAWLPLMKHTQQITRFHRGYETTAEQEVVSPMISGAVLLPDFEVALGRWRDVDGVIDLMTVGECVVELLSEEVQQLRWIEAIANTPKSKRERKFELGELVRVTNGPFRSFAARVERFDSRHRLTVGIELFGRVSHIVIDESDLEPAPAAMAVARDKRKRGGFRCILPRATESR